MFILPCNPTIQDFKLHPPGLRTFAEDPEHHPLSTPTGKLEFTSTGIKKNFPDDPERPPYPKWVEASELHDERLSSPRAKDYPLLCMSNHGRWRFPLEVLEAIHSVTQGKIPIEISFWWNSSSTSRSCTLQPCQKSSMTRSLGLSPLV